MTNLYTEYQFAKALVAEELKDLLTPGTEMAFDASEIAADIAMAATTGNTAIVNELQAQLRILKQTGVLVARQGRDEMLQKFIDRGIWVLTRALTTLVVL